MTDEDADGFRTDGKFVAVLADIEKLSGNTLSDVDLAMPPMAAGALTSTPSMSGALRAGYVPKYVPRFIDEGPEGVRSGFGEEAFPALLLDVAGAGATSSWSSLCLVRPSGYVPKYVPRLEDVVATSFNGELELPAATKVATLPDGANSPTEPSWRCSG